ncbi:hypothetical protein IKF92_00700 [Candidatus Saccharibacteria bacterium]|nr:hypothetical protein [Candidatus Saccharibacteria bacterium]
MIYEVRIGAYTDGEFPYTSFVGTISDRDIDAFADYLTKTCGFVEFESRRRFLRHQDDEYFYDLEKDRELIRGETTEVAIYEADGMGSIRPNNFKDTITPLDSEYHLEYSGRWSKAHLCDY